MSDATPGDDPWAFRAKELSHRYPDGTHALHNLTADIPAGRTTAILGPSGCGKSTLLNLLGLLWDEGGTTGSLLYRPGPGAEGELELLSLPARRRASLRAASFGFVLQSNYLLPAFTCLQNVAMPLALHGWPSCARERWASELLEAAGVMGGGDLAQNQHRLPRQVSAGQRQRYAVLRSLLAGPSVVFADEPSSNLDPGNTEAMFNLLRAWRGGEFPDRLWPCFEQTPEGRALRGARVGRPDPRARTLVVVCHDLRTAYRHADRFVLMRGGRQIAAFAHATWDERAHDIEEVLGLNDGDASSARLHGAAPASSAEVAV